MLAPRSYLFSRTKSSPSLLSNPRNNSTTPRSPTTSKPSPNSKLKYSIPQSPSSYEDSFIGASESSPSPAPHKFEMPSSTMTSTTCQPTTPTTTSEPVIIPTRSHRRSTSRDSRHGERSENRQNPRKTSQKTSSRRPSDVHSPDAIPPSVAALLAITSIPQRRPSSVRRNPASHHRLTVDAILKHTKGSEKEYSFSLGKSPLDVLLSPPEDDLDDEMLGSDIGMESYLSVRSVSSDSVPSLDGSSIGDLSLSLPSLSTPTSSRRRSAARKRLQSVSSPPRESVAEDHPLSDTIDVEALDFSVFEHKRRPLDVEDKEESDSLIEVAEPRRRSAFKSNLTASLKALRSAARSFSSLTSPAILPDDFLTRSIITIDPRVPFTDERMPPRLEDTPTPALRRYLNPTTNAPIEAHLPASLAQTTSTKCTASIQMRTYKVSKNAKSSSPRVISRRTPSSTPEEVFAEVAVGPVARQRDMRENSDFIRIAVMEMLMRRNGKLDEKVPGRAKWALPPRKPSTKAYEIGEGGIPRRWIPVAAQND